MSIFASLLPLVAMGNANSASPVPPPLSREFRAVWVASVANIDWPSRQNLTADAQKAELIRILDLAKATNLNAVIFQIRPSADALYDSKIEPWSEYLTGRQGQGPKPSYDPLAMAVDEAHKRGIELHCWFNPYRAVHPAQKGPLAPNHILRTNPSIVKKYGPFQWMDPGEPAVQDRSLKTIMDVVDRYDIDGVHIDDYFYPYKEKGPDGKIMDFPDDPSYAKYRRAGGRLGRDDWRRKNVDDFVQRLYTSIKRSKSWVKFGISPFGIWRPGYPSGIKAGVDQYADLYADARKWLQEGWCDYLTPQLYWPVKQTAQSYPALLDWWMEQNPLGRHLWPGNFTSRTNPADGNWKPKEVLDQIAITRDRNAAGNVHFSMKAFLKNYNGIATALQSGPYLRPALVPPSPWLDDKAPNAPKVVVEALGPGKARVRWRADGDRDVRFFVVTPEVEGKWLAPTYIGSGTEMEVDFPPNAGSRLAISAIDRAGNESPVTVVDF